MKRKIVLIAIATVMLVMVFAAPAFAARVTKIMYNQQNVDVYSYTPAVTGTLTVTLSWANPTGVGSPVYPQSEVDAAVQCYDSGTGELYYDVDYAGLYSGTNPCSDSGSVTAAMVGKTIYIDVLPWINQVPYRLVADYNGTTVIDTGAIDITNPAQKWAYGQSGEFFLPNDGGDWLSVVVWKGTKPGTPPSDVWANWDDYVWGREDWNNMITDNYSVEYVAPIATPHKIAQNEKNKWFVAAPEIWTPAARPNVWTTYATDLYPKPGTMPDMGAASSQAWYTYTFPDSGVSAEAAAYFWGTAGLAACSWRNVSNDSQSGASLTYKFYGTSVKWIYTTGNKGGIQKVTIDGVVVDPAVDQYSAALTNKVSKTYSGLTAAAHTLKIESTKTKNPLSGGLFLYHDNFEAMQDSIDPTTLHSENNLDGSTAYDWARTTWAGASGSSLSSTKASSGSLAYSFEGTSITWGYIKYTRAGIANVYIDGVLKEQVDQYNAGLLAASKTYSGLASGLHTIFVVSSGTKNASSLGLWVYHDYFQVGAGAKVEN